ncbi:MAG: RIP metalloprotease RseP, partial [Planctomycetes bacterium]|nr:RIP metalloprotease RseP [Planctomycetota bacterium]
MVLAVTEPGFGILAQLEQVWLWIQVFFGIGLMIFIHELGHFLAAKKVGVRVETFSLGFGPRMLGFRKGDTDYRLSWIPLGGYVKMAGENPGEEQTNSPDELYNRRAGERMLIFAAGVFMNFLFAFLAFPIIFAIGIPFEVPEIGQVTPGGPAWQAGLLPGDKILEVNGNEIYQFNDIQVNIALGHRDGNEILVERNGKEFSLNIAPKKNDQLGLYQIGITPMTRFEVEVDKNTTAALAGLQQEDRVLTVNETPVATWSDQGEPITGGLMRIEVEREGVDKPISLSWTPEEIVSDSIYIGIEPLLNKIKGMRGELAKVERGLLPDDIIIRLNGRPIYQPEE